MKILLFILLNTFTTVTLASSDSAQIGTSLRELFDDTPAEHRVIVEEPVSLPTLTRAMPWTAFKTDQRQKNRFYIALDSLTQGETDHIFRYVIKIVTATGTENIRFEGLSCRYKIYRPYAFAQHNEWVKASNTTWLPITRHGPNNYPAALFDTFCRSTTRQTLPKIKKQFTQPMYDLVS